MLQKNRRQNASLYEIALADDAAAHKNIKSLVHTINLTLIALLSAIGIEAVEKCSLVGALVCVGDNFGKCLEIGGTHFLRICNLRKKLGGGGAAKLHHISLIGGHLAARGVGPTRSKRTIPDIAELDNAAVILKEHGKSLLVRLKNAAAAMGGKPLHLPMILNEDAVEVNNRYLYI